MLSTRLLSRHFRREAIACLPQLLAQQHRPISIQNCNPAETPDVLFHLGLSSDSNLAEEFGDVKFFCTGGSAKRMRLFAEKVAVSGSISRRRVVDGLWLRCVCMCGSVRGECCAGRSPKTHHWDTFRVNSDANRKHRSLRDLQGARVGGWRLGSAKRRGSSRVCREGDHTTQPVLFNTYFFGLL